MENPLVTVFIPVYNSENYINECLDSIFAQTYQNFEILLVDDGSTDRTVEKIKTYHDPRIRLICNGKNMGIPYTRNVGLQEARGKYMAIMDADDISMPERLEKQVSFLEQHPDIDAVSSFYIRFGERLIEKKVTTPFNKPEEIQILLLFFDPIANPATMVRLETLRKHHLIYNPAYFVSQDYDLFARLSTIGKIAIIPEFLLKYRFGHENITKKSKRDRIEKRKRIINQIHADLLKHYQIPITGKELAIYNEFFSYNYGRIEDFTTLIRVIDILKSWNQKQSVFDQGLFLQILDYAVVIGLSNQQIYLKHKLGLFRQLIEKQSVRDFVYILTKHFYYKPKTI